MCSKQGIGSGLPETGIKEPVPLDMGAILRRSTT